MGELLTAIGVVLGAAVILAKAADQFLTDAEKRRVGDILTEASLKFADTEPLAIIRGPFRTLRSLFDVLLGERKYSRRAFLRTAITGNLILFVSLAVGAVAQQSPFLGGAPWELYDKNVDFARKVVVAESSDKIPEVKEFAAVVVQHDCRTSKALYCVGFIAAILVLNSILDFACMVLARQLIGELEEVRGLATLVSAFVFNLFFALTISVFIILIVFILAFPISWPFIYAVKAPAGSYALVTIVLAAITSLVLWYKAGLALRTIVVVAILPGLMVAAALAYAMSGFPLRKQIHEACKWLLFRVANSGKGAFATITALLTVVGTFVAFLAYLSQKL